MDARIMPRPTLGEKTSRGESRVWKLRVSEAEDKAARESVAEGETLSDLIRLAVSKEVDRRKKRRK
jgi:hypothetical protein